MSLIPPILESLRRVPDKVVCRDSVQEMTAGQVLTASMVAAVEIATGTPAERVGILLPNGALGPPAFLGVLWAGKVPVPLNPLLKPTELHFILEEASIDTVVVAQMTQPLVAGLGVNCLDAVNFLKPGPTRDPELPTADPHRTAVVLYTSGTAGRPKGVRLTHDNLLTTARHLIQRLDARSDDIFVGVLPFFHSFGVTGTVIVPWLLGAEVTYTSFVPDRVADLIHHRRATAFLGVPNMFRLLARSKVPNDALRSLRRAISGGDALPSNIHDSFRQRFGQDLLEGYGLTETCAVVCVNVPGESRPGTAGRPIPGTLVRIWGEDGREQPAGSAGEIQVRGPNVTPGYFQRPEEDAAAFTVDGWFRTGDRGSLDPDGYLSVSGRIKELIIRDGEKIMPREIEEVLGCHPGVVDAAVVGEPDGGRGQAVVAYVVPAYSPPTADELRVYCREKLADYKVPRRFVIAPDLPRGPTGKILKRLLKEGPAT
jgi:long-chain acyl-CoA synthetase